MFERIYEHHAKKQGTKMLNNLLRNISSVKSPTNNEPIKKDDKAENKIGNLFGK